MTKTAFLFPGQGSQHAGMGKSLADTHSEARRVFEEADETLGFSLSTLCFEGPDEELRKTENTQPALLTCSVAAWRVLEAHEIHPEYVAGHSLGEYSALVAAGSLKFADAVRLVRKRGCYMQDAVPHGVGAMAAILRLRDGKLQTILEEAAQGEVLTAANFNSPDQVVIAGHTGAVHRAVDMAKAAGAKHAVLLHVSAPFHSPLMRPAQERMRAELEATEFLDLRTPLVNNVAAREIRTGNEARDGLIDQIQNPVRWTDSVRYLAAQGVTHSIEVGPGHVLTGLLKSIAPGIHGARFHDAADLEKVHAAMV